MIQIHLSAVFIFLFFISFISLAYLSNMTLDNDVSTLLYEKNIH